jgi:diketogulonate reductase-like aldo/keto reductase
MPTVGLGTSKITGRDSVQAALQNAISAGYRLVDTATPYNNEADIGASLKDLGVTRKDIFITTKLPSSEHGKEKAGAAIEKSLANLCTDYIDLYLIHWPGVKDLEADEQIKKLRLESWTVLEDYHKRGVLRAIGVSNYEVRHLEELLFSCTVPPHVNQIELHPHFQNKEVLSFCKDKGIQVTAYRSLGMANASLLTDQAVVKVANECKKSAGQVLLKWAMSKGASVIPKSTNRDRMKENMDLNFKLSEDHMKCLDEVQTDTKYCRFDPRNVI